MSGPNTGNGLGDGLLMKEQKARKNSQFAGVIKRLGKNRLAVFGLTCVILLVLIAVFADFIAPYDYAEQHLLEAFQPLPQSIYSALTNSEGIFSAALFTDPGSLSR